MRETNNKIYIERKIPLYIVYLAYVLLSIHNAQYMPSAVSQDDSGHCGYNENSTSKLESSICKEGLILHFT